MNKIYYTVEKQLANLDGIKETNGLADINLYKVKNNELIKIGELIIQTGFYNNEEEISDFIDEFISKYNTDKIEFIKL
jgi:hypothetical protein